MDDLPTIRFGYVATGEADPQPANELDERDPDLPATVTVDRARFERLRRLAELAVAWEASWTSTSIASADPPAQWAFLDALRALPLDDLDDH